MRVHEWLIFVLCTAVEAQETETERVSFVYPQSVKVKAKERCKCPLPAAINGLQHFVDKTLNVRIMTTTEFAVAISLKVKCTVHVF